MASFVRRTALVEAIASRSCAPNCCGRRAPSQRPPRPPKLTRQPPTLPDRWPPRGNAAWPYDPSGTLDDTVYGTDLRALVHLKHYPHLAPYIGSFFVRPRMPLTVRESTLTVVPTEEPAARVRIHPHKHSVSAELNPVRNAHYQSVDSRMQAMRVSPQEGIRGDSLKAVVHRTMVLE